MQEKESENFSVPDSQSDSDWEKRILLVWNQLRVQSSRYNNRPVHSVQIKFYPYKNGSNSVRYDGGVLYANLHTQIRNASPELVDSLLRLLVSKLLRLKVRPEWKENVLDFLNSLPERKVKRAPNLSALGQVYDLNSLLKRITEEYFPKIDFNLLSIFWSDRIGKRRLGSYDKESMSIRISPVLDHGNVPLYVLEHVIHHEVLHHILPVHRVGGRNAIHSPLFKRKEKEYLGYREALHWLRKEYPRHVSRFR